MARANWLISPSQSLALIYCLITSFVGNSFYEVLFPSFIVVMHPRSLLIMFVGCVVATALWWSQTTLGTLPQSIDRQQPKPTHSASLPEQHLRSSISDSIQTIATESVSNLGFRSNRLCGSSLLSTLGLTIRIEETLVPQRIATGRTVALTAAVEGRATLTDALSFNVRAVGPVLLAARIYPLGLGRYRLIMGPFPLPGKYVVEVWATWLADKYLGQRWFLPPRNDNPSFAEKRRKCLALRLEGDCERFGASVANITVTVLLGSSLAASTTCTSLQLEEDGYWSRMLAADAIKWHDFVDPVGLNTFDGSSWLWSHVGCSTPYLSSEGANSCLARSGVSRIVLFGDSMIVELFFNMRQLLSPAAIVTQGKVKGLRWMQFLASNLVVRFMRGYKTVEGHSVIAPAAQVLSQIAAFSPDVAVGNLAVLHWQQNERKAVEWRAQVAAFVQGAKKNLKLKMFYVGHTLIHMGRTQGLQPSRTAEFASVARQIFLGNGFGFIDPYNMSVSRKESAYDGQHWACYHEFGGVAQTIAQLALLRLCGL